MGKTNGFGKVIRIYWNLEIGFSFLQEQEELKFVGYKSILG